MTFSCSSPFPLAIAGFSSWSVAHRERARGRTSAGLAALVDGVDDGECSRFHLIFTPHKTLCRGNEKPGAAQSTVTPER